MRRILAVLGGSDSDRKAAGAAIALAKRLGAQVEGLYIKIDPSEVLARMGEGITASATGDVFEAALEDAEVAASRAKATLESVATENGVAIHSTPSSLPGPGVFFESVQGPSLDVLDSHAGLADLVVFGEPGVPGPLGLMAKIEHTMLTLRRPILVARGDLSRNFGERVLVAFKGSHEACTALMRATPIIKASKAIEILYLREHDLDDHAGKRAARYLGQHGANAKLVEVKPGTSDIGAEIARYARAGDAGLIVMGGYGRSRMRELILGGATRHLIRSSPMPVFLAH